MMIVDNDLMTKKNVVSLSQSVTYFFNIAPALVILIYQVVG